MQIRDRLEIREMELGQFTPDFVLQNPRLTREKWIFSQYYKYLVIGVLFVCSHYLQQLDLNRIMC